MSEAKANTRGPWLPAAGVLALAFLLAGCAGDGGARSDSGQAGERVRQCKAGDERVARESDCLQDDAACYALASGDWCTGERGSTCPSGSSALAVGTTCPPGARCFPIGESLTCVVTVP